MAEFEGKKVAIDSPLNIATLNVRGLKKKKKKHVLFRAFKEEKLDIVALQETYIKDEEEMQEVYTVWGGEAHFTPGTIRSKGLITLFHPKYDNDNIKLIFKSARVLISSIKIENEILFVVNVYSPCVEKEKLEFLNYLYAVIKEHCGDTTEGNIICLGDFNIAISNFHVVSGLQHKKTYVSILSIS